MKVKRHTKIIEIINKYDVDTQEELAEKLFEAGFRVTQATVSRDIRELKLTKVAGNNGKQRYVVLENKESDLYAKYVQVLKTGFLSMDQAQNILVIKTVSGMAMAVAAALDELHIRGIVGSIAGDDTVMCAIRNCDEVPRVMEKIRKLIMERQE
ncbi:MAG: arginine repressor [Lachnospiraceae bacterium]|nr:arginine repressor [Lachnospiraceae bacterium]